MKNSLLIVGVLASGLTFGQDISMINSSENQITLNHELVPVTLQTTIVNGNQAINFGESHKITSLELGSPELPFFTESIHLPNRGKVVLTVEHDGFEEIENVEVTPSKGNLKRNVNPSDVAFTYGEAYQTDAFFPGNLIEHSAPYIFRTERGVTVQFNPYQYNPVTKTLRVYQNLRAVVSIDDKQEGWNEIAVDQKATKKFNEYYSHHFINYSQPKYTPVEEEGHMLIITDASYQETFTPFVDWKREKGISTTVVTTDVTGTTDTEIKSYIADFYADHPELTFVLLGGDHDKVKSHTYGMSGGEQLWSDSYYGQLAGGTNDYYPEVFVGRFSGTASQIQLMINRTLDYEKTPAAGDWMTKAIGIASSEGNGYGNDGEADWVHARNNRQKFLDYGYTEVYEFYQGSQGGDDAPGEPLNSDIQSAVNSGVGLFNYTGHGAQNVCVTGNFSSSDINGATNEGKYPFVISVACNNGTFTSGTCISEIWQRAKMNSGEPTGAIAACGSSILMAWAPPMETQDEMTNIITEQYANNKKETLGGLFYNSQIGMMEDYNNNASSIEVMQTWIFFGDPSTVYRNKVSQSMNVSHVGNITQSETVIYVSCDVEGATVVLTQWGIEINRGIVQNGVAAIYFDPFQNTNHLVVTATKQNYIPYQGLVTINGQEASIDEQLLKNVDIYPNPTSDVLNVRLNGADITSISIVDLSGKVVSEVNNISQSNQIDVQSLNSGMYMVRMISSEGNSSTKKITIK